MSSKPEDFQYYFNNSIEESSIDDNSFLQNIDSHQYISESFQMGGTDSSSQSFITKFFKMDSTPVTNSSDVAELQSVIPLDKMSCHRPKTQVETIYEKVPSELVDSRDPSLSDSITTTPAPTESSTLPELSTTQHDAPPSADYFSQSGGEKQQLVSDNINESNNSNDSNDSNDSTIFEPNLTDSSDYWSDVLMDSCDSMDCITDTTNWSTTYLDDSSQQIQSGGNDIRIDSITDNTSSLPVYSNDPSI